MTNRTMTVREKAQRIARSLRKEEPDYYYLKELFRHLRNELNIKVSNWKPAVFIKTHTRNFNPWGRLKSFKFRNFK